MHPLFVPFQSVGPIPERQSQKARSHLFSVPGALERFNCESAAFTWSRGELLLLGSLSSGTTAMMVDRNWLRSGREWNVLVIQ